MIDLSVAERSILLFLSIIFSRLVIKSFYDVLFFRYVTDSRDSFPMRKKRYDMIFDKFCRTSYWITFSDGNKILYVDKHEYDIISSTIDMSRK
jgi:hypothetical protein